MFGFTIRRLAFTLLGIPVIIWLMLALARLSPVDPVEQLIDANDFTTDKIEYANIYSKTAERYQLSLPSFYFTLTRSNYTKDFYSITHPIQKQFSALLLQSNFSYQSIQDLYQFLIETSTKNPSSELADFYNYSTKNELFDSWNSYIDNTEESIEKQELITKFKHLNSTKNNKFSLFPKLIFFGKNNQFHKSISSLFSLKWGNSIADGKSVKSKIFPALRISFFLIILSLILGYSVGILLGIWFHIKPSALTKAVEQFLYIIKSVPFFVFALFMLIALTTEEISSYLKIFPAFNAYGWSSSTGFWHNLARNFNQLILPTLCITIFNSAYISRQVKASLDREKIAFYNTTANMKGINKRGLFQHRFKNIKGILITMIGSGFISSFSGSLLIECIFNIPGIGRLLIFSVRQNDLALLIPIILIIFLLSSITLLLSDILYQRFNPKISIDHE